MKNVIFTILFLISFVVNAQEAKEGRDLINQVDYEMLLKWTNSSIRISTYKTPTHIEKTLILKTRTMFCDDLTGITLKLSNGEVLTFENAEISCAFLSINNYILQGAIEITPELYATLSQLEITEFTLGKIKVPVKYNDVNENLKKLFEFSESN